MKPAARTSCPLPRPPPFPASLVALSCLVGCSRSPSQDVLGSFFPAWMLCAGLGIAVAAGCRVVLGLAHLHTSVLAPPLGYSALAVAVASLAWLYQFGQ